jgi:DNA-binding CsgD family transcriptional regulator
VRLQSFLDISQATSAASFERQLVAFAHEMDFGLVLASVITEIPGSDPYVVRVGNTPEAFLKASTNLEGLSRDPVNKRMKKMSLPVIYDQNLYVREHAGDLWEEQAPYGYRTGIAVGLHLTGNRHFMLGVDRDQPLPKSEDHLTRMLADLQLLAVHAQDAAIKLLAEPPTQANENVLSRREIEVVRLTMLGKTAREIGELLSCSEFTVNTYFRRVFRKLDVTSKHQAVLKALHFGML